MIRFFKVSYFHVDEVKTSVTDLETLSHYSFSLSMVTDKVNDTDIFI